MLLGYNTNGFAHHDLFAAVELLAEIGYRSVAVTIDHHALAPESRDFRQQLGRLRRMLGGLGMRSVIETGARFLLDPHVKHEPTLVSREPAARQRRVEFYRHAIRCAAELESDCVSLWSGTVRDRASPEEAMDRLVKGLAVVLDEGAGQGVAIALEPEPGMLVDTMADYEQLLGRVDPEQLRLTLDVGHVHCQDDGPIDEVIRRWAPRLVNVHLDDMRRGVHEHLMIGEGEIDFGPVLGALEEAGYAGGLHVELSRHSHAAPEAAREAFARLSPMVRHHKAATGGRVRS